MSGHPTSLTREYSRSLALEAGFSDAGVVALPHAEEKRDAQRFEEWVRAGRAGTMHYLERTAESGELGAVARGGAVSVGAVGGGVLCALRQRASAIDCAGECRMRDGLRAMRGRAGAMKRVRGGPAIITKFCSSG